MTLPILIICWGLAILSVTLGFYFIRSRPFLGSIIAYFGFGFFFVALPLKIAMASTSLFGMLFLAVVWPVWLGQNFLGYSMVGWFPDSFLALLFNF